MDLPMTGAWTMSVHGVRPFTIHGDLYYEVHATRLDVDDARVFALRIAQHAMPRAPSAGETIEVSFLMGQVTAGRIVA